MPNPHFNIKIVSRKAGQSAVACASYRSSEKLFDARADKTFDYTRKEDVLHAEIMAPENTPDRLMDRGTLWNEVEQTENRKDAQLARDFIAGLPRELEPEQNKALVQEYVTTNFVEKGMIADFAIHESSSSDGGKNPHAHIMLTMRDIDGDGFGKKNRDWNKKDLTLEWRDSWQDITNKYLENAGSDQRLSLQSYKEQNIDKIPQKHTFVGEWQQEKAGIATETGDHNREVKHKNALNDVLKEPEPAGDQTDNTEQGMETSGWQNEGVTDSAKIRHFQTVRTFLQNSAANTKSATVKFFQNAQSYGRDFAHGVTSFMRNERGNQQELAQVEKSDSNSIFSRYSKSWTERETDRNRVDKERDLENGR